MSASDPIGFALLPSRLMRRCLFGAFRISQLYDGRTIWSTAFAPVDGPLPALAEIQEILHAAHPSAGSLNSVPTRLTEKLETSEILTLWNKPRAQPG